MREYFATKLPGPAKQWIQRNMLLPRKLGGARIFAGEAAPWVGGFNGRRVLEVGSDQLGRNLIAVSEHGAAEVVGVNPVMTSQELSPGVRILREDASKLPFDDGYFDVAITDSTLEHVHDLSGVLKEVHRVVRSKGRFYARYGPIWSTPYGHHLWIRVRGRAYTYWDVVLPSWCHLLDAPEATREFCLERLSLPSNVTDAVIDWVYESEEQNRLFYDDYRKITVESPWSIEWFKGYDHPDLAPLYGTQETVSARLRLLRERWPDRGGWLYDGAAMVLERH